MVEGKTVENHGLGFNRGIEGLGRDVVGANPGVRKLTPKEKLEGLKKIHEDARTEGIESPKENQTSTIPPRRQPDEIDYVLRQGSLNGVPQGEQELPTQSQPSGFDAAARLIGYEGTKGKGTQPSEPTLPTGGASSPRKP